MYKEVHVLSLFVMGILLAVFTSIRLSIGSESISQFPLLASDYYDHLTDQALLSVTVLALVEDTHQSWVGKKTLPLGKPTININMIKVGGRTC